jgi:hypothetical protein
MSTQCLRMWQTLLNLTAALAGRGGSFAPEAGAEV